MVPLGLSLKNMFCLLLVIIGCSGMPYQHWYTYLASLLVFLIGLHGYDASIIEIEIARGKIKRIDD